MDYNARFYSPRLGRFVSADSIVPNAGNPGAFDRYSYVLNNPVKYTDPTGHCISGGNGNVNMGQYPYGTSGICPGSDQPDSIDPSKLTKKSDKIGYSGEMMYDLYVKIWNDHGPGAWWWDYFGADGYFTIEEFLILILAYEYGPYEFNGTESDNLSDQFIEDLKHAAIKNFWCSPNGETNACTNLNNTGGATKEAILNWLGGMESGRRRYDAVFGNAYAKECGSDYNCRVERALNQDEAYLSLAAAVAGSMLHPSQAAIVAGWTNGSEGGYGEPWGWANKYLYPGWHPTGQGRGCSQYLQVFGSPSDSSSAFILSFCQVTYALVQR